VSETSGGEEGKIFEAEAETRLNNIQEFSPYRKENTTLHRYRDQPVNAVKANNRSLL
jgi:hypothetical protein